MEAAAILALIRLITVLEPVAVSAVQALVQKMQGMTPEQIAALTVSINNSTIAEIDAELAKLPPTTTPPPVGNGG